MSEQDRKKYIINLSLWLYYYNNIFHMLQDNSFDDKKDYRLLRFLEVLEEYDFLLDSDYNFK